MSLYETIGTSTPSELLAKVQDCDVTAVPMEPGNGIVKRGTILYRKDGGFWAPAAAANAVTTNQVAILDETIDTTGLVGEEKTIAENARVFRAGHFIRGKVTLANDTPITSAVELVLRKQGMVFDPIVGGDAFDNSVDND